MTTRTKGTFRDGAIISPLPSLYTPTQIEQYLVCIGLPQYNATTFPQSFENLERLILLHLQAFPMENTEMHYTLNQQVDITPEGAFNRFVLEKNGSYCFGHAAVFLQVLRGLGYRAFAGSARLNEIFSKVSVPRLSTPNHAILFVQPFPLESDNNNQTYVVDPWFGTRTLVRPLLLSDSEDNIIVGTSPYERHRLTRLPHPSSSLAPSGASEREDFYWNIEYHTPNRDADISVPWRVLITFTEDECFPEDAEGFSFLVCNKTGYFLQYHILAVRHLSINNLDQMGLVEAAEEFAQYSEDERKNFLCAYTVFDDKLELRIGRRDIVLRILESEADRIEALSEYIGLDVTEDGYRHILGRPSSLDRV